MHRRQPLPRLWLMTDERQGEGLWAAVHKLPRGSGIVFRHYGLSPRERAELFRKLRLLARRRGLVLVLAGARQGAELGSDGRHGRDRSVGRPNFIRTAPAHDIGEMRAAERAGAELVFLSPAFETRSHSGVKPLGALRFRLLARQARVPVIALGGMNPARARRLSGAIYGWAGIDAWT